MTIHLACSTFVPRRDAAGSPIHRLVHIWTDMGDYISLHPPVELRVEHIHKGIQPPMKTLTADGCQVVSSRDEGALYTELQRIAAAWTCPDPYDLSEAVFDYRTPSPPKATP